MEPLVQPLAEPRLLAHRAVMGRLLLQCFAVAGPRRLLEAAPAVVTAPGLRCAFCPPSFCMSVRSPMLASLPRSSQRWPWPGAMPNWVEARSCRPKRLRMTGPRALQGSPERRVANQPPWCKRRRRPPICKTARMVCLARVAPQPTPGPAAPAMAVPTAAWRLEVRLWPAPATVAHQGPARLATWCCCASSARASSCSHTRLPEHLGLLLVPQCLCLPPPPREQFDDRAGLPSRCHIHGCPWQRSSAVPRGAQARPSSALRAAAPTRSSARARRAAAIPAALELACPLPKGLRVAPQGARATGRLPRALYPRRRRNAAKCRLRSAA